MTWSHDATHLRKSEYTEMKHRSHLPDQWAGGLFPRDGRNQSCSVWTVCHNIHQTTLYIKKKDWNMICLSTSLTYLCKSFSSLISICWIETSRRVTLLILSWKIKHQLGSLGPSHVMPPEPEEVFETQQNPWFVMKYHHPPDLKCQN